MREVSKREKRKIIEEYQQENDPHYYGWGIPHENYKRRRPLSKAEKEYLAKYKAKKENDKTGIKKENDKTGIKDVDFVPPFRRK